MRNGNPEGILNECLVKHREMGPAGLRGELITVAGADIAEIAGEVSDCASEIVPGTDTFIREMINTRLV